MHGNWKERGLKASMHARALFHPPSCKLAQANPWF